ncbi:ribosome recycling factor [SAR86 cluster bacterium]|jgi:ribosome recycling factor|nr:ribosome recycling factor [Gammaproteobacteria bacterium]MDA9705473.1 ribosome recycling factor [SAR86 cluster bacterium]MEC7197648.1 ribosome recycling factor [Pseudomonadota bacterium]MDA9729494.1 ribosome recycling factor [SAR86 cluster bacterium]MDC2994156.1 ribosome recycling factor [SAR86 cluster bacterium]|tara:strand:- start:455 stop:1012 length:558 start_codon:yes stop_codon:yes gene_type:complete
MLEEIKQETLERMEKSISSLESSLQKIRTGRANPSLLDAIQIDYYGNMTPLSQVSNISVQDAKTLLISPWEKNLVPDIEKAIQSSDLGINPATSGDVIRVILPDLTEETRRDLIKVAKSEAENSKIALRNQRRDANGLLKEYLKEKEISEDDERRGQEIIQNLTDDFISKVEQLLELKEKDLLEI